MKLFPSLLFEIAFLFVAVFGNTGNYDCSEDDCSFYDFDDPRNSYMDLFLSVERDMNGTLNIPSWNKWLLFYDGNLTLGKDLFEDECSCPLILKEDKVLVTFHASNILDMWYSYKFPFSRGADGALQISCAHKFSARLVNGTKQLPKFESVEVTYLTLFNCITYGIPLEWVDNLPDRYIDLIMKSIYSPVKKLLEDTLLKGFNEALGKMYR